VTTKERSAELAAIWARAFDSCVEGHRVVALPEGYGVARLGGSSDEDCTPAYSQEFETAHLGIGAHLLKFSDSSLMLLAAANPTVRTRFDRLQIRYASKLIDTPELWQQSIDWVRAAESKPARP